MKALASLKPKALIKNFSAATPVVSAAEETKAPQKKPASKKKAQ